MKIKEVEAICIGQFSGECAQFRADVTIPPNTFELFENQTSIWVYLDIVDWVWQCTTQCNSPFLSNSHLY